MSLTYAEFCAGYGGLGLAVEEVFGAELKWYSEFDAAPSKIMAHHWPGVPNHGDMTAIDWNAVEHVDILSGGTPCQDLSAAGRRKGMTEGTRSNLWVHMREAIAVIKPTYVVWENVRGAYSASADSDLEQCPGCVGDTSDGRVFLRALGRVLGDLSDLGYDCQWRGLRAGSDSNEGYGVTHAGSCHARFRVFVVATHRDHIGDNGSGERAEQDRRGQPANSGNSIADADDAGRSEQWRAKPVQQKHPAFEHSSADVAHPEGIGRGEGWTESARVERGLHAPIGGYPSTADADSRDDDGWLADSFWEQIRGAAAAWRSETNWGEYEPAIRRWEHVIGRPAPRPTEPTGRNGGHRLSPRFTEWMMGLDDGWVTAPEIGLTRNEQLKACGNGVVPQQAIAALRDMTTMACVP